MKFFWFTVNFQKLRSPCWVFENCPDVKLLAELSKTFTCSVFQNTLFSHTRNSEFTHYSRCTLTYYLHPDPTAPGRWDVLARLLKTEFLHISFSVVYFSCCLTYIRDESRWYNLTLTDIERVRIKQTLFLGLVVFSVLLWVWAVLQ